MRNKVKFSGQFSEALIDTSPLTTKDFNSQMLATIRQTMLDFAQDGEQRTASIGGVCFSYASFDELSWMETMFASRVAPTN